MSLVAIESNAYKISTFFPLHDNDGKPFSEETWDWWHDQMARFKGYTDMGKVLGIWERHTDENRWIFWIVQTYPQVEEIKGFLIEAKEKFSQLAIYYECQQTCFKEL